MQRTGKRHGTAAKRGRSPEPRIGTVTFSPGHDSENRLWQFFNLAVGLATGDKRRRISRDTPKDGRVEEKV